MSLVKLVHSTEIVQLPVKDNLKLLLHQSVADQTVASIDDMTIALANTMYFSVIEMMFV